MPYPTAQEWRQNDLDLRNLYERFKGYRADQQINDPGRIQELTVVIGHMFWALDWLIWQNEGLKQQ